MSAEIELVGIFAEEEECVHAVDVLKRNVDGMAAVKMNILHLHLSDDQKDLRSGRRRRAHHRG